MESSQDLGTLITVCTIIICVLCLCVLKKTGKVPSYRLQYGDTHDLIRKPARILNERKMDSVQWRISRKQPNIANNHFNQVGFMTVISHRL